MSSQSEKKAKVVWDSRFGPYRKNTPLEFVKKHLGEDVPAIPNRKFRRRHKKELRAAQEQAAQEQAANSAPISQDALDELTRHLTEEEPK